MYFIFALAANQRITGSAALQCHGLLRIRRIGGCNGRIIVKINRALKRFENLRRIAIDKKAVTENCFRAALRQSDFRI